MTTIKIDGATISLTPEQLADIDRQRQQPKEPEGLTWEQAFDKVKPKIWLDVAGYIVTDSNYVMKLQHLNVPSEKHAKSVAAQCKLMVIAEAYNMGREKGKSYFMGEIKDDKLTLITANTWVRNPIIFFCIDDLTQSFITNRQLWLDFFMVEQ